MLIHRHFVTVSLVVADYQPFSPFRSSVNSDLRTVPLVSTVLEFAPGAIGGKLNSNVVGTLLYVVEQTFCLTNHLRPTTLVTSTIQPNY